MIKLGPQIIEVTKFPDGTSNVWNVDLAPFARETITWEFEKEEELIHVIQLAILIKKIYDIKPKLYMPYLPYARQDKHISNVTTWSLYAFMDILSGYFSTKYALDIHNPDAEAVKWTVTNIDPIEELTLTLIKSQPDFLVFPDDGARQRYLKLPMLNALPHSYCEKVRDQLTGEITGLEFLNTAGEIEGKKALIVDDIVDGGRTFIEVAKKLKEHNVKDIDLYTTHGIYSKGKEPLIQAGITGFYNRHIYKREI